MLHDLNIGKFLKTLRNYLVVFLTGAFITAMLLDNRIGAIVKAFQFPEAVNTATFSTQVEVVKK